MTHKTTAEELFDSFADELLAERNVRPLVIVGASKIDALLLEILRGFFLPKTGNSKTQDELLEGENPLSTFSARIKICRRLGLIDETLYSALEKLRVIRNLSAHSISFDHSKSPVREHLSELKGKITGRSSYRFTKERYFDGETRHAIEEVQCLLLTLCVLLEAARKKVSPTSGNRRTLRISAR